MKKIAALIVLIAAVLPSCAFAHASPVSYEPGPQSAHGEAPTEVRIRFSERLEEGASRIVVVDAAGNEATKGAASVKGDDPYVLFAPLAKDAEDGAYFVKWSVVSRDDGHFTRGEYVYFVGQRSAAPMPQIEVVQSSAGPEAFAIGIELLGNSLLWGLVLFFALVLRYVLPAPQEARMLHWYRGGALLGGTLALTGASAHLYIKTTELAALSGVPLMEALDLYLSTAAGEATVIRAGIVGLFTLVAFFGARTIIASRQLTLREGSLLALLILFAYFRAKISHATANPFLPQLSVMVNAMHLIGKDAWAGLLAALSSLYLFKSIRDLFAEALERAMPVLSLCFGAASVTACYIVWLHLRAPGNLTTTLWGERLVLLATCGTFATLALAAHVFLRARMPERARRIAPLLIGAELALGILIVFFSSLMIITSPPADLGKSAQYRSHSEGRTITLSRAPYEDDMALLTIDGPGTPTLMIDAADDSGLLVELTKRFEGGYVFPLALLEGESGHRIEVRVVAEGMYDATASFAVEAGFGTDEGAARRFDLFTGIMLALALSGTALAAALYKGSVGLPLVPLGSVSAVPLVVAFIATGILMSQVLELSSSLFANRYKAECVRDGGAWHLMLPTRDGVPVSIYRRAASTGTSRTRHPPRSHSRLTLRLLTQACPPRFLSAYRTRTALRRSSRSRMSGTCTSSSSAAICVISIMCTQRTRPHFPTGRCAMPPSVCRSCSAAAGSTSSRSIT
jgi:copper transport protein